MSCIFAHCLLTFFLLVSADLFLGSSISRSVSVSGQVLSGSAVSDGLFFFLSFPTSFLSGI